MAIFAKIANFAKIASLQGATFGIQFKSPPAGDFSPVSPFSPLHAFLGISGEMWKEAIKMISAAITIERHEISGFLAFSMERLCMLPKSVTELAFGFVDVSHITFIALDHVMRLEEEQEMW